ncbi:MAG: NnrU family protein, partial [Stellaceae bacterium]
PAPPHDPAPGIMRVTRHPVMWALGLWALSHLAANGDLRSIWFFGVIAALALGGTLLIDRKKQIALGSYWQRLAGVTSNIPFAALVTGRTRLRWRDIGLLRPLAALLLYVVLYLAHPLFAGVPVVVP